MSDINCVKQVLPSRTNPTIVSWKGGAVSQVPLPCYVFLMFDLPKLNNFWDFYSVLLISKFSISFIWLLLLFQFFFVHSKCSQHPFLCRFLVFSILVGMHGYIGRTGFRMEFTSEAAESTRIAIFFKHKPCVTSIYERPWRYYVSP